MTTMPLATAGDDSSMFVPPIAAVHNGAQFLGLPAQFVVPVASNAYVPSHFNSADPVTWPMSFAITICETCRPAPVKVKIDDPLSAHFDQLGKYTDADMHNVYAYLETLK